jgi:hypothetical protein
MFNIDLEFPHTYEIEELAELPGTGQFNVPVFYFPRPKNGREHDGLWLKIRAANGLSWVGVLAFGYRSAASISRIISSPAPDSLCVVSRGAAYIVKVNEPDDWEESPALPVTDVRCIPDHQLLILADFTRLAAYGRDGRAWVSPRLCWDGLKILRSTSDTIEGVGYDPTNSPSRESIFAVDIRTGRSLFPAPISVDGKPVC